MPKLKGRPEIITLKVKSKDARDEVATLGLRVGFECGVKKGGDHD